AGPALGWPRGPGVVLERQQSRELGTLTSRGLQLNPAITAAREASAIIVAVKPQVAPEVVPTLRPYFGAGTVLVSIMAGRTLGFLEGALPQRAALVRAMPNTPAPAGPGQPGAVPHVRGAPPPREPRHAPLSGAAAA